MNDFVVSLPAAANYGAPLQCSLLGIVDRSISHTVLMQMGEKKHGGGLSPARAIPGVAFLWGNIRLRAHVDAE